MKPRSRVRWMPVAIVMAAVAVCAIVMAETGRKPAAKPSVELNGERRTAEAAPIVLARASRRPLSFYTSGVRADLFTAPAPPAPPARPQPPKPAPPPPPAPAVVNPFADYAYTGTVNVGGKALALVENSKTKEGQYLREGDPFLGGTVARISDRSVVVTVAGAEQQLNKTDDFKLVPFDKAAPYLTAQPTAPGQPGQPGQPGAAPPGAPGAPAGFPGMDRMPEGMRQRMQQRMERMSPEERQQFQNRWMNRSFEGRGRRRGGQ